MKLLLAEDDRRLADVLQRSLVERGHTVEVFFDGVSAFKAVEAGSYDALILDVMLPERNGLTIARELRRRGQHTPIIMATARDTTEEIIAGLDAGADDYLVKPFELAELEARLRSIVRRSGRAVSTFLRRDGIELDLAALRATRDGRELALTAREAAFLEYFMRNSGIVVSRRMIADALWDEHRDSGASNIIDVYVGRLRAKLTTGRESQILHTIRGAGYRFGGEKA